MLDPLIGLEGSSLSAERINLVNKVERDFGKNGKEDSIIDVGQDDSQDDVYLKESPLKWFGKKWFDFLSK